MRYYLGIDNGGTTIKVALFNMFGQMVGVESIQNHTVASASGFLECDMQQLWQNNCLLIRRLLQQCPVSPREIVCVGLCGHGKGLYLWGKDGRPIRGGILSADNRAWQYPERWRTDGIEDELYPIMLQPFAAGQPVCLLAWLRDHEPESLRSCQWIFSCKDYIRFRLTGKAQSELTDCSGSGLLDLRKKAYSPQVLERLGLSAFSECLPPLCTSLELCGSISSSAAAQCGLCDGTPVIGGMFDIDACALALNVTDSQNICMIAGTWSINEFLHSEPAHKGSSRNSLSYLPEYYLIEESSPTSAGNCEWFLRQIFFSSSPQAYSYSTVNELVSSLRPEEDIPLFLPFLYGSNSHPLAKSAFVALHSSQTPAHLLRGIYEGVAFSHYAHLQRLLLHYPGTPCAIRLAGGAARSPVWAQIFSDVCRLPVQTSLAAETGALGCAIAAAAAIGDFPSLSDAAAWMSTPSETYYPKEDAAQFYRKKYALYDECCRLLLPLWSKLHALT